MTLIFIRIFFILISTVVGYQIGASISIPFSIVGGLVGLAVSVGIIALEVGMKRVSVTGLSSVVFGLIFGLILSKIITDTFLIAPIKQMFGPSLQLVLTVVFCYLGMVIAIRGRDEFKIIIPYIRFKREDQRMDVIILDTSAIIDGRIADICQTKFIEGRFIIPRFVLKELQQIADSADTLKRNRGRRGLDVLNKIQKSTNMDVKIHEDDFPDTPEVDAKLVKLGKILGAKILTTDFNLNKVAELEGVSVLNINDLANALKPIVLPGEAMQIHLIREGKEFNQAVAYLDDGTMVVVDNAKDLIGRNAEVVVTSVLQTSAGRMIFAKLSNLR